jgi:cobalt-zinc-cadmium efflux system membrane fusion protein
MTRRFTRSIAALLACLLAGLGGCDRRSGGGSGGEGHASTQSAEEHHGEEKPEKPARVKLSKEAAKENEIKSEPVAKRVLVPVLEVPARVAFNADGEARVGAQVAGRVGDLKVHLGDSVHKGDELLVVESPDLGEAQSDYLQKRTALQAAAAAVEPLKESFERGQSLYNKGQGVSLAELQKRTADYKAAQAAARAAEGAFKAAENKVSLMGMPKEAVEELARTGTLTPRYSIRTPIDGQVVRRDVTIGSLVAPDKELAVEVADLAKLWVIADVPESHYGQFARGAKATVAVPALPEEKFTGSVTYVASAFEPATRTVQVRVEVNNEKGMLRPGMFARCEIETTVRNAEPVLAVPDDAVLEIEGHPTVFVPAGGDEPTYEAREVKAGPPVGGWVPVLSGLKEGENVVTHGAFILKAQLGKPAEEE